MATKADFTEEEWKALQSGVSGAGMLVAVSDAGFWDTFKEASALAKHVSAAHTGSESALVREIADHLKGSPFGITASPEEVESGTVDSLHAAIAALQAKSPEDLDAYKQFVLDVAQSVAEAAHGVSEPETEAIGKVKAALGDGAAPAAPAAPAPPAAS
jgi:hypothetical protein